MSIEAVSSSTPNMIKITEELQNQVNIMLEDDAHTPATMMAQKLNATEGEITRCLPRQMASFAHGHQAENILEKLPSWGRLTTIVAAAGSIFEVKADFPKGKIAHGFYNLMGKEGQLHGHLRIDLISEIAFVAKPFRGMESFYIGFFTASGECMFKVYLGRDKKRQLFPEQIELFNQLKQEVCA